MLHADYTGSGSPQSSGTCLKLHFPGGDSALLYTENSSFKIQAADLSVTSLVPDMVDSLLFVQGTKSIQTYLSLSQNGKSISSTLIDVFRNAVAASALVDTLRPMGVGVWSGNTPVGDTPAWKCTDEATSDGNLTHVYPDEDEEWRTDSYETEDGSGTGTIDSVFIFISVREAAMKTTRRGLW